MGLDYALEVEIITHDVAIELLIHACEAVKHETWSTRIRVIAHAIVDGTELWSSGAWIVESIPTEYIHQVRVNMDSHLNLSQHDETVVMAFFTLKAPLDGLDGDIGILELSLEQRDSKVDLN